MPKINYMVMLSNDEEEKLKNLTHKGSGESARTIMHAHILLLSNDASGGRKKTNREIADIFDISLDTVNQVRRAYTNEGLEAALR